MIDPDLNMMAQTITTFFNPGDTLEVRALDVQGFMNSTKTWSGYFLYDGSNAKFIVGEVLKLLLAKGIYFTLNPVNPSLLARSNNRMSVSKTGSTTSDKDILRRLYIPIDIDPVRQSDTSATDAQVKMAYAIAKLIFDYLIGEGWPKPITCFSGNGCHLLCPVDLPCDDNGLVKKCLEALALMFDTEDVKVDTSVFNPARIVRFYGTVARKGDPVPELEIYHRVSKILSI